MAGKGAVWGRNAELALASGATLAFGEPTQLEPRFATNNGKRCLSMKKEGKEKAIIMKADRFHERNKSLR